MNLSAALGNIVHSDQFGNQVKISNDKLAYSDIAFARRLDGKPAAVVALMPNGASYYYASDWREFTWDAAVREADKILPHCQ